MKTYKKSEFTQRHLADLSPGDSILVLCSNYNESENAKQTAYNAIRRTPREDVLRYKVDRDLTNYSVLITAVAN